MTTVRVIFHEATRTGSPRVLHQLLSFASAELGLRMSVDIMAGGPLENDLRALSSDDRDSSAPGVVIINSALAAGEATRFGAPVRVGVYVHEMGEALENLPGEALEALRHRCEIVWCVSSRSADELASLGVERHRIRLLPPVVTAPLTPSEDALDDILGRLGAPVDSRLVVGCGEATWRKGADLFLDIARRLEGDEHLSFVWAGRRPRAFGRILDQDTRGLNMSDRVIWTGELDDVVPLLRAAAVVVVPSREDPQPLVPLEAALCGTPSVGFDTGGMASMAAEGACIAVPYPDTAAFADRVRRLLADESEKHRLADDAAIWVRRRHSIEILGPAFTADLEQLLADEELPRRGKEERA